MRALIESHFEFHSRVGRDTALRRPRPDGRNEHCKNPALPSPDAALGDGDSAACCPYQFLPSVQSADSVFIRVHPWFMTVKWSAKLTKPEKSRSLFNAKRLQAIAGSKSDFSSETITVLAFLPPASQKEMQNYSFHNILIVNDLHSECLLNEWMIGNLARGLLKRKREREAAINRHKNN